MKTVTNSSKNSSISVKIASLLPLASTLYLLDQLDILQYFRNVKILSTNLLYLGYVIFFGIWTVNTGIKIITNVNLDIFTKTSQYLSLANLFTSTLRKPVDKSILTEIEEKLVNAVSIPNSPIAGSTSSDNSPAKTIPFPSPEELRIYLAQLEIPSFMSEVTKNQPTIHKIESSIAHETPLLIISSRQASNINLEKTTHNNKENQIQIIIRTSFAIAMVLFIIILQKFNVF